MRLDVAVHDVVSVEMLDCCSHLGEDPSLDCGKMGVDVENLVYVFELGEVHVPMIKVNGPVPMISALQQARAWEESGKMTARMSPLHPGPCLCVPKKGFFAKGVIGILTAPLCEG
jgi:hypothetical protein